MGNLSSVKNYSPSTMKEQKTEMMAYNTIPNLTVARTLTLAVK
jgi:hypothetical protein